jgi:hypothetical protein
MLQSRKRLHYLSPPITAFAVLSRNVIRKVLFSDSSGLIESLYEAPRLIKELFTGHSSQRIGAGGI